MKKTIIFIVCVFVSQVVRADYWEIASYEPGELCWGRIAGQDDNTGHDGVSYDEYGEDFYNVKCEMPREYIDGPAAVFQDVCLSFVDGYPSGSCLSDYVGESYSLFCVAEASYNLYVEDFPCDWCRAAGEGGIYGDWSEKNSNNAISRTEVYFLNEPPACVMKTYSEEWGCPANYYKVSGTGSSMVCAACPSNATCPTFDGNTGSFVCIVGYYKDGSSCTRCPSSGGVYGTTKSTGATSITECYIPSGSSFSDTTGAGVYTSDCYYSN